jgi:hypothetical protein
MAEGVEHDREMADFSHHPTMIARPRPFAVLGGQGFA